MKSKFTPTINIDSGTFCLYINGLLHLRFETKDLVAFHSYKDSDSSYGIDVYLLGGVIVELEYNKFDKWQSVLKQLDKART